MIKTADQFLDEVKNKPVYYFVYAYYDAALDIWHQPLIAKDEPEFMLEQLKGSILKGQIDVKNLVDLQLVYLGKFDLKSGKFELLEDYQAICDCNQFIKKPEERKDA